MASASSVRPISMLCDVQEIEGCARPALTASRSATSTQAVARSMTASSTRTRRRFVRYSMRAVCPAVGQILAELFRRRRQRRLLALTRLPALQQAGAVRANDVDLGTLREQQEEAALDARPRAQLPVDAAHVAARDDGDVHAERREPLDGAPHGARGRSRAAHGGALPREGHHREVALEVAGQVVDASLCHAGLRLSRALLRLAIDLWRPAGPTARSVRTVMVQARLAERAFPLLSEPHA